MSPAAPRRQRLSLAVPLLAVAVSATLGAQTPSAPPQPAIAEGAAITVLKGLTVPQFENEMRHFVQALGMNCGGCHTRGNFASEDNPRKATARRMIEMTKRLNQRYFAAYTPGDAESTMGRVTCFTCHQGEATPKSSAVAPPLR